MPFVCTVPLHSTVQTRHSAHQPHPNHLHHHYHSINNNNNNNNNNDSQPQPPLPTADHRVRNAEESHQPNSRSSSTPSSADPTRFCLAPTPTSPPPPHPPPKPTTAMESKMATTPTRSVAWPPRLTPLPDFTASQPFWPSQKARAERKHSVYVNAAIYPLREQPQTPNGSGDRTQSGGGNTCRTPPNSWTHLLPYRTSTVPQNLSERLKKSETLPNDVWVHTQRQNPSNEQNLQTAIPSASAHDTGMDQSNRPNGSAGIPTGLKSPPPRPPVRTSSQQLTGRGSSAVEPRAPRPIPTVDPISKTSSSTLSPTQIRQSTDPQLSGLLSSEKSTLEDSPILCRYSQLYSLSIKPEPSERARYHSKPLANHSDSPVLSRPNMATRVESQMHKLRIRTEDLG
ncbi:hypothetical protein FBUS_01364 [Fasciolopsis buskii]|uniref:Uncharacterized protein n=1 Tax=Fasciolopsis buskii TaxID=27845 RepID=A0A8E0RXV9_9TREM|nr:hypothetical protein FBUS_01364 [Fasciolopsis buski]